MGSPQTAGPRVGVIIALRPDVKLQANAGPKVPANSSADAGDVGDRPYQLSLFDPSLFDGVPE